MSNENHARLIGIKKEAKGGCVSSHVLIPPIVDVRTDFLIYIHGHGWPSRGYKLPGLIACRTFCIQFIADSMKVSHSNIVTCKDIFNQRGGGASSKAQRYSFWGWGVGAE